MTRRDTPAQIIVDGTKLCSKCGEVKPVEEFNREPKKLSGRAAQCKVCHRKFPSQSLERRRVASRRWYAANKHTMTPKRYGLSAEQYAEMVERQKGRCGLCGEPPTERGLSIDHDHDTDQVRALLCINCNSGLGLFRDDPQVLQLAIDYLKAHGKD